MKRQFSCLKAQSHFWIKDFLKQNRICLLICCTIVFFGLLTGILTATRIDDISLIYNNNQLLKFINGDVHTFAHFFDRILSCGVIVLIVIGTTFVPYISFIGLTTIAFRAYLLGLNCVLIFLKLGFGGIVTSVLIILPLQLCMIMLMCFAFCFFKKKFYQKRKFGTCCPPNTLTTFALFMLALAIICAIECLLLFIFQCNVIIVL
ncbi:MAG: hypothetical protein RR140_00780 [Clostridia bacterium]